MPHKTVLDVTEDSVFIHIKIVEKTHPQETKVLCLRKQSISEKKEVLALQESLWFQIPSEKAMKNFLKYRGSTYEVKKTNEGVTFNLISPSGERKSMHLPLPFQGRFKGTQGLKEETMTALKLGSLEELEDLKEKHLVVSLVDFSSSHLEDKPFKVEEMHKLLDSQRETLARYRLFPGLRKNTIKNVVKVNREASFLGAKEFFESWLNERGKTHEYQRVYPSKRSFYDHLSPSEDPPLEITRGMRSLAGATFSILIVCPWGRHD